MPAAEITQGVRFTFRHEYERNKYGNGGVVVKVVEVHPTRAYPGCQIVTWLSIETDNGTKIQRQLSAFSKETTLV